MKKIYLNADDMLADSYQLAMDVFNSGFRPDLLIGIWRGGAPVAIAMHEMLHYLGHECDHMPVRTSSYSGIGERNKHIKVAGIPCLPAISGQNKVLLVDDVFDTGLSLEQLIADLRQAADGEPDIRIATLYFKPANNRTGLQPDYYRHKTTDWLVFPHELDDLPLAEVIANKPALKELAPALTALHKKADSG